MADFRSHAGDGYCYAVLGGDWGWVVKVQIDGLYFSPNGILHNKNAGRLERKYTLLLERAVQAGKSIRTVTRLVGITRALDVVRARIALQKDERLAA